MLLLCQKLPLLLVLYAIRPYRTLLVAVGPELLELVLYSLLVGLLQIMDVNYVELLVPITAR